MLAREDIRHLYRRRAVRALGAQPGATILELRGLGVARVASPLALATLGRLPFATLDGLEQLLLMWYSCGFRP